jgi:amino acid transporter
MLQRRGEMTGSGSDGGLGGLGGLGDGAPSKQLLGTFMGVFLPCICTIFGVVVYLRLGFLVGQAGVLGALLLLGAAFLIAFLTILSLSALVSNGQVHGGGLYGSLRKSIGPDLAAVIGIMFVAAYTVGIANYAIGFAHALVNEAGISSKSAVNVFPWNAPGSWVETLVASLATFAAAIICSWGVIVGTRALLFVFALIVISLGLSMVSCLVSTTDPTSGHTAFSINTLRNNTAWDLTPFGPYTTNTPWLMFEMIFPGFTGVIAGANLSGDLRTPRESIVKGTLLALLFALATYLFVVFVLGSTVERPTLKTNMLIIDTVVSGATGLPIVFVGICATTLSSVLSYMMGAPRVLQAIAKDNIFPILAPFGKGWGASQEPVRAIALTWAVSQLFILIGDLNLLLPVITGSFLTVFCTVNITCFILELSPATFRPHFQLYSRWSALLGFILSLGAMFLTTISAVVAALLGLCLALATWRSRSKLATVLRGQGKVLGVVGVSSVSGGASLATEPFLSNATRGDGYPDALSRGGGSGGRDAESKHAQNAGPLEEGGGQFNHAFGGTGSQLSSDLSSSEIPPGLDNAASQSLLWDQDLGAVKLSASYVRDALKGRFNLHAPWALEESEKEDTNCRLWLHRVVHNLRWLRSLNLIVFLSISFFERPIWCFSQTAAVSHNASADARFLWPASNHTPGGGVCAGSVDDDLPLFGLPVFDPSATRIVELICICIFTIEMITKARIMGTQQFLNNKWYTVQIILITADLTGVLVSGLGSGSLPLWNPILRPLLFVCLSQSMRGALTTLLRTLPSVMDSVVLITLLLVVYSTIGVLLFRNTEEGEMFFSSFPTAMVSMLVLLTTANYPDVMMPAYSKHRASVLFFVSFLLIGLFFCMNLVLASVYNNYKVQLRERARTFHRQRRLGLTAAFHKLDTNKSGFVRIASCARVLNELSRPNVSIFHWENSTYQETQKTRVILQTWWNKVVENVEADKKEEGEEEVQHQVGEEEQEERKDPGRLSRSVSRVKRPVDDLIPIHAFCEMMISVKAFNEDETGSDYADASPNGLCYKDSVQCCKSLGAVLKHRFFDWSIGVIVVLNTVIIIVQADINAQIPPEGKATSDLLLCETLNDVFGYFYVVELLLKMLVLGSGTYWKRLQHRFDALTAALVVVGQIIIRAAIAHDVPLCDVIQYVLLLRLTRTLRLVVLVRRFNEIFGTFVDLIPAFSTLFGMMWTVFSVFASVGMVLFGGKIRYSSVALNGTDYAESDYYANNFNDFTSSLVTLFELLVGESCTFCFFP